MAALSQMRSVLTVIFTFIVFVIQAQDNAYLKEIKKYREEQNKEFLDPNQSPLTAEQRRQFEGHDFFPIDPKFRVIARFEPTPEAKPFQLKTSTGTNQIYRRLGILHFELEGTAQTLEAYLRVQSFGMASKVNYVFLPVIDATTGKSTYGAGRYLHYEGIPDGEEWVIDFNKLYNPLCAYADRFECPLVPEPNHLTIPIMAGIKGY